jgi:hypothetical protein
LRGNKKPVLAAPFFSDSVSINPGGGNGSLQSLAVQAGEVLKASVETAAGAER